MRWTKFLTLRGFELLPKVSSILKIISFVNSISYLVAKAAIEQ